MGQIWWGRAADHRGHDPIGELLLISVQEMKPDCITIFHIRGSSFPHDRAIIRVTTTNYTGLLKDLSRLFSYHKRGETIDSNSTTLYTETGARKEP